MPREQSDDANRLQQMNLFPSEAPPSTDEPVGIDSEALLRSLRRLKRQVCADLARTFRANPDLDGPVSEAYDAIARESGVAISRERYLDMAATVYVLKALFLRVAEDHGLFPATARKVASRGDLFREMRDLAPRATWADYLEFAFRDLAYLPVAYDLFAEGYYERIPLSGDAAERLLEVAGGLPDLHQIDTRFLGDIYEGLMESAEQKRLGYFTTPDFIIDFLLERTLEPAMEAFALDGLRYLDPACGTGHFLLRAYRMLDRRLREEEPELSPVERYKRIVENNLYGIDVSPFAVRITLFRLFLEGVRISTQQGDDPSRWAEDITFNVYAANALVRQPEETDHNLTLEEATQPPRREVNPVARFYRREASHLRVDLGDALVHRFHVVNANPPYVRIQNVEGDVAVPQNAHWERRPYQTYLRDEYESAYGKFDISLPFVERGLDLLAEGGWLGYITTGKFARQRYGRKLVSLLLDERYQLRLYADLNDAEVFSSATTYPCLLVMQRSPLARDVEVLTSYESPEGDRLARWHALLTLLQGDETEFVPFAGHYWEKRDAFRSHPWALRRGNHDLLSCIVNVAQEVLTDYVQSIGFELITGANPVFLEPMTHSFVRRQHLERELCIPAPRGSNVRNWRVTWRGNRRGDQTHVLYTHDPAGKPLADLRRLAPSAYTYLLRYRRYLEARRAWGRQSYAGAGLPFHQLHQTGLQRHQPKIILPRTAMFAEFVFDENGRFACQDSCEAVYFRPGTAPRLMAAISMVLSSRLANYVVKARSSKLSGATRAQARYDWSAKFTQGFLLPSSALANNVDALAHLHDAVQARVRALDESDPYSVLRHETYTTPTELWECLSEASARRQVAWQALEKIQRRCDILVESLYQIRLSQAEILATDEFQRPWHLPDWREERQFEIVDLMGDMLEGAFREVEGSAAALTPSELAHALGNDERFEPLRAVYYDNRATSAEEFVRVCLNADCRPIPYDPDDALSGRRPKRVDVVHERFFRFDGQGEERYGWTGWSPEAQADVFLRLARRATDPVAYYRWVARLIDLPSEQPDIGDSASRAALRRLIGSAEPFPYVVMET